MHLASRRVLILGAVILTCASARANAGYEQTFLVSDIQGLAANTDTNLKNPWGVSFTATSPFWVSDQGSNLSTLYNGAGVPNSLVVSIPTVAGGPNGPTGQVSNGNTNDFLINGVHASFIFDNLNGQISGFTGSNTATAVVTGTGAIYTGLAIGQVGNDNFLFAADSRGNKIDVYGPQFQNLNGTTYAGTFVDPNQPANLKVYNIQNINGILYVTYGNGATNGGAVAEFGLDGHFIKQLISNGSVGPLQDPWGITLAPQGFGQFGGDLLVGNKENGQINAFDPSTGAFLGLVTTVTGNFNVADNGLWALDFRTGGAVGTDPNTLYAFAGINNEANGLVVAISPVPEPSSVVLVGIGGAIAFAFARRRRALNRD